MPEGDTVYQEARTLNEVLADAELTRCDIRVPKFATVDLSGERVHDVVSRGKHLLMRVGEFTIHSHLKMEGSWHVYRHGTKWKRPGYQARAVLETADWVAVGFDLGVLEVLPTRDEEQVVGYLGPDLLGPDWEAEEALRRLSASPERPIGLAVLDQRVMAGLGNVYRVELCFVRGVLPTRPVGEVHDLPRLVDTAHRMLVANKDRPNRVTTGNMRQPLWVYGREGQPCLRCGTSIRSGELGDDELQLRVAYWCPHDQT